MAVTISGSSGITFPDSSAQSAAALLGAGTWSDVAGSRAINTTYTNNTGKLMIVQIDMDYGDLTLKKTVSGAGSTQYDWVSVQHPYGQDWFFVFPGESWNCVAASGRYFGHWWEYVQS